MKALNCICNIISYCSPACNSGCAATLAWVICLFQGRSGRSGGENVRAERLFLVCLKRSGHLLASCCKEKSEKPGQVL